MSLKHCTVRLKCDGCGVMKDFTQSNICDDKYAFKSIGDAGWHAGEYLNDPDTRTFCPTCYAPPAVCEACDNKTEWEYDEDDKTIVCMGASEYVADAICSAEYNMVDKKLVVKKEDDDA